MQIPTLNPLRFYKPNATKLKDNLSFADASDYWNALPGSYTPKFQEQVEAVVYEEQISGAYGFSSIDEFITSGADNPTIENCKACIDSGSIIYTNLDGAVIGKKLIVKIDGDYDIEVREDTTVVDSFTGQSGIFTYVLDQDYTNLTVKISSSEKICISGVMLCEPEINYTICDDDKIAELIDCCPFGGVYLITLKPYFNQTIDFLPIAVAFVPGTINITVSYTDGTTSTGTTDGAESFDNQVLAAIDLIENVGYTFTSPDLDISSTKEIEEIQYEQGATRVTLTPTGTVQFDLNCCKIIIGDYQSEYFAVITEEQKESLKLLKLDYSSEFMDLNVAFSDLWTASLLINAELIKGSGSDIEVFVGQSSNVTLENFAKKVRVLKTGAIPDYLCDMLSNVFGFDTITIEGEEYAAEEGPEEASFEDRTDLFQLEVKLRKQNFEFLI